MWTKFLFLGYVVNAVRIGADRETVFAELVILSIKSIPVLIFHLLHKESVFQTKRLEWRKLWVVWYAKSEGEVALGSRSIINYVLGVSPRYPRRKAIIPMA